MSLPKCRFQNWPLNKITGALQQVSVGTQCSAPARPTNRAAPWPRRGNGAALLTDPARSAALQDAVTRETYRDRICGRHYGVPGVFPAKPIPTFRGAVSEGSAPLFLRQGSCLAPCRLLLQTADVSLQRGRPRKGPISRRGRTRERPKNQRTVLIVWKGSERSLGCWIVAANAQLVEDPRELGRRLEDSIMDQFAVNTRCGGVAAYIEGYDKFDGKFNAVAMQAEERNDYWGLMVDYAPGSKVYSWALFPTARSGRPNGRMISGEGAASQIAEQVCIVVTGRGASVR
jgi:hypothetical protein